MSNIVSGSELSESEGIWIERAQLAEATIATIRESMGYAIERIKVFKSNFGIREKSNGEIEINYDKFVKNLGSESALELRNIIDEHYVIKSERLIPDKLVSIDNEVLPEKQASLGLIL